MGAYLSQPITDKDTEDGGDESGLRWGAAGMQGWRTGMEDDHVARFDIIGNGDNDSTSDPTRQIAAFAVFDGHGGAEVAKYCSAHICDVVKATKEFQEGDHGQAMRRAFLQLDDNLRSAAGQAELSELKKACKDGSDSDDGDEDVVDVDLLSKMNPETHMQIVEHMKKALKEKCRSAGMLDEDNDSDVSDDSDDDGGEECYPDKDEDLDDGSRRESSKLQDAGQEGLTNSSVAVSPKDNCSSKPGPGQQNGLARDSVMDLDVQGIVKAELSNDVETSMEIEGADGSKQDGTTALKVEVGAGADSETQPQNAGRRCGYECGATAVMGLLVGGKTLVVANAGDSRCVVSRKGVAVEMSTDHKPEDELELTRIEKAGGTVIDGRVQGNLNLSRAIGDLMYKADKNLRPEEQMITAEPELRTLEITDEDEFIVFACDGVWNSLSSQETIDFVRKRLNASTASTPLSAVCSDLCDACCADNADGDGTGLDNVTVVMALLKTSAAVELFAHEHAGRGPADRTASAASASELDSSDDGKRKQGVEGSVGDKRRGGKQMRPTETASSPRSANRESRARS